MTGKHAHVHIIRTGRIAAAAVAVVAIAATLTGCAGAEAVESDDANAIVYTIRNNQPVFDPSAPAVDGYIQDLLNGGGTVTVIVADGNPQTVASHDLDYDAANDVEAQKVRTQNVNALSAALTAAVADDPEADVLAALSRGADAVRDAAGAQRILMIDSGLSTAGAFSMTNGLLGSDPALVADYLAAAQALPDLTGITVTFYGLGETAGAQQPLDTAARNRLTALWAAVVDAAGGTLEVLSAPPVGADSEQAGLPFVSPVPVDAVAPPEGHLTISLQEEQVRFLPDTAQFADPTGADVVLAALAGAVVEQELTSVSVTGTTASTGNPDGERALALARATAVRDRLVSLGVPAAWFVSVEGLGADFPGYVDNWPGGVWDDDAARQNRQVTVTARH
ncbi:MAG TPA: OmpA family protein [Actinomycetaceae bacterium]|nr:OmpA family protein [Actinomycetaceae bacterium]